MDEMLLRHCGGITVTEEYKYVVQKQNESHEISQMILSIAPGLGVISLFSSAAVLVLIILAMSKKHLPRRKYSVIASRTIADCFYAVIIIAVSILANNTSATLSVVMLFIFSSSFEFIHLSLSHLIVIALRQATTKQPYSFQFLTVRKLIAVLVFIWILAILYSAAFSSLATVIVMPKYSSDVCSYRECQKPLLVISLCLIGFLLFTCILYYCTVVQTLRNVYENERTYNQAIITRQRLLNFLSYGAHVLFFAVIAILMLICTAFMLHSAWTYEKLRILDTCRLVDYIETVIRVETLSGSIVMLYCCRGILDSVLLLIAEYSSLLPWLVQNTVQTLDENYSTFSTVARSNSLKWYCTAVHCPITTMEKAISAWDMKN